MQLSYEPEFNLAVTVRLELTTCSLGNRCSDSI